MSVDPLDPLALPTRTRGDDTAALAKGGRTNFLGFVLRLVARLPFLFIAGQLYGAEALGRFAYATMVVELMAALATLGLKRGLAAELTKSDRPPSHVIGDGLLLAWVFAAIGAAIMVALPEIVFPNSKISGLDRIFPLVAIFIVGSDVTLAALAYQHNIKATVTARSIIEPWTITVVAAGLAFVPEWRPDAMIIAYAASLGAAFLASIIPCLRMFGIPHGWSPHPGRLFTMMRENLPLAGADVVDWATRRIDILILGQFAAPAVLGVYYVAQQVTSLPQKLKMTFEPILAPVIAKGVKEKDYEGIAVQLRQVGFWILSAQLGIALTLGLTGEVIMGLVGDEFGTGAGILALLLAAEVFYVTAGVSESALVYMARHRNLIRSLIVIGIQIALTLLFVNLFDVAFPGVDPDAPVQGIGAALALALAACIASIVKVRLLHRLVPGRVNGWRWVMLPAALVSLGIGALSNRFLPEFWQVAIGLPLILCVYAGIMWSYGFKGPDRLLFQRVKTAQEEG